MFLCLDAQQPRALSSSSSSSGDVVDKASGLQKNIDGVSRTANQLTVSFFVLLGWVVLVTVALLSVVAVTFWRWRRQRRRATAQWDDVSRSTSDAASVCSRSPTERNQASAAATSASCRDSRALESVEVGRRSQTNADDSLHSGSAEP